MYISINRWAAAGFWDDINSGYTGIIVESWLLTVNGRVEKLNDSWVLTVDAILRPTMLAELIWFVWGVDGRQTHP